MEQLSSATSRSELDLQNFQVSSITDLLPSVRAHRAIQGSQPVKWMEKHVYVLCSRAERQEDGEVASCSQGALGSSCRGDGGAGCGQYRAQRCFGSRL